MRLPRAVEKAASYVAIPNVTVVLIGLQALCMLLMWSDPTFGAKLLLDPQKVAQGEWWRVITFVFLPISTSPLWAIFEFYFFWLMGTALERNWGTVRYNVYLWIALLMSAGSAFIPWALGVRNEPASNTFVSLSVFVAFAFLYPDFQIYLFFILRVRIKWLALLAWLGIGYSVLMGDWTTKAAAVAGVANFFLFFWHDLYQQVRYGQWSMRRQFKRVAQRAPDARPFLHKCVVCGATEVSAPQAEFRYCAECGGKCYCMTHLQGHVHTPP